MNGEEQKHADWEMHVGHKSARAQCMKMYRCASIVRVSRVEKGSCGNPGIFSLSLKNTCAYGHQYNVLCRALYAMLRTICSAQDTYGTSRWQIEIFMGAMCAPHADAHVRTV